MFFKRRKLILITGYPYFLNRLQELGKSSSYNFLNLPETRFGKWLTLLRADLIYIIGGNLRPNRYYRFAFFLNKKIIMHWVGSDILEMKAWQSKGNSFCPLLLNKAVHWAEVDWTASELSELGVKTSIVPLTPAVFPGETSVLPEKFVALTYLPPGKEGFYGEDKLIKLAARFPEVLFLAAASLTEVKKEWPTNLVAIGWIDNMAELYKEVTLLIRMTDHDGLSFMVLEALANGRHVIWSYPFTGVLRATDDEQLYLAFNDIYQTYLKGELTINNTGREIVNRYYNPQVVWKQIDEGIRALLKAPR